MKEDCIHCESTVIRKVWDRHNCYDSISNRVDKLDKTLTYAIGRYD